MQNYLRAEVISGTRSRIASLLKEIVQRMSEFDQDITRTIMTSTGANFQVHLWEDRTRGEIWVPSYDPACLALVDENFLRTTSSSAVDSGCRTFEFRALVPGCHRLLFEKRMGWKFTAEARREFIIEVTDGVGTGKSHA